MRKAILVLAWVLFLAAGILIGWFAAKRGDSAKPSPTIRYRAASQELLAPAPTWEEWKYPSGRVQNSSSSGGGIVGEIKMGRSEQATLLTADAFDKVWTYYQSKCKLPAPGVSTSTGRLQFMGTERAITITVFDDIQPSSFEGLKSELIQARGFSVESLRYTLVGFVYRLKGADETCIHLVYRTNSEFIGLLKEKLISE